MTHEEQRLSQLLKRLVPEPPFQLSASQVATRSVDRSVKSWTLPALAAAAVVVIGVTTGVVATHDSGPGKPTTPLAASTTAKASGTASPSPTASCAGQAVTVPNVVGLAQNQAVWIVQAAGLTAGIRDTASGQVPPGTVIAQSPSGGSEAVPRAEVQLTIAAAPSTSTAVPAAPGTGLTGSPGPMAPCQTASGSPAAEGSNLPVPNLTGMTSVQAIDIAEAAGFSGSVEVTEPPHGQHVQPGTVFAQAPAAGSSARGHARITIFVVPVTR